MTTIAHRAERSLAARAVDAWRARWFPPAELADLAVARILLVLIVLYLNGRIRFLSVAHAPALTWDPVPLVEMLGLGQPTGPELRAIGVATRLALYAGALGLATNVALLTAFVLQLVQEAWLNCFGKVTHSTIPLLHAMLFFALAPCGRVLSLDALLRAWRTRRTPGAAATAAAPRRSRFARWPFELLLVELAFYYFDAGLSKLSASGLAWADGWTLQYFLLQHGTPLGLAIAPYRWLCAALSAAALAFELGFPLAVVFRRLRPWFLLGGVCFHVGNDLLLDLIFWPVIAVYPLVVPWSALRDRAGALLQRYAVRTRATNRSDRS